MYEIYMCVCKQQLTDCLSVMPFLKISNRIVLTERILNSYIV